MALFIPSGPNRSAYLRALGLFMPQTIQTPARVVPIRAAAILTPVAAVPIPAVAIPIPAAELTVMPVRPAVTEGVSILVRKDTVWMKRRANAYPVAQRAKFAVMAYVRHVPEVVVTAVVARETAATIINATAGPAAVTVDAMRASSAVTIANATIPARNIVATSEMEPDVIMELNAAKVMTVVALARNLNAVRMRIAMIQLQRSVATMELERFVTSM